MRDPRRVWWTILSYGAGALATMLTRRLLVVGWQSLQGAPPPDSPGDRGTPMRVALIWAVATGVGVGVMRLLAIRGAARGWEAVRHEPPPIQS